VFARAYRGFIGRHQDLEDSDCLRCIGPGPGFARTAGKKVLTLVLERLRRRVGDRLGFRLLGLGRATSCFNNMTVQAKLVRTGRRVLEYGHGLFTYDDQPVFLDRMQP
jgi:hypothetical protein